jgi:hypothetical protein
MCDVGNSIGAKGIPDTHFPPTATGCLPTPFRQRRVGVCQPSRPNGDSGREDLGWDHPGINHVHLQQLRRNQTVHRARAAARCVRGVLTRSPRHRAAEVWRIGANPGAAARSAWQCGERGRALRPGLGSGLGPWIGARGAPQQSPILRPGQRRLSLRLGSAPIAR